MVPPVMAPATVEYIYDPYGVVLIIGAFNFPINLTISPLIGMLPLIHVISKSPCSNVHFLNVNCRCYHVGKYRGFEAQ